MTDSYHFHIEPEPAKEAQFRIGGVYRRNDQTIVRIARMTNASHLSLWQEKMPGRHFGEMQCLHDRYAKGYVFLDNGWYVQAADGAHQQNLIPGELIERDGQWVAADAPIVFPSGAAVLTSGDKIVGRVEAGDYEVSWEKLFLPTSTPIAPAIAPQRAPLPNSDAWRGIGHKAHDTFGPDFIVTKGAVEAPPTPDPTTQGAYPAIAGLLRG